MECSSSELENMHVYVLYIHMCIYVYKYKHLRKSLTCLFQEGGRTKNGWVAEGAL